MIRRFVHVACLTTAATLAVAPSAARLAAQPVRIDFAEYTSPTTREYAATVGQPLTSKGFDFYEAFGPSTRNALGTWGTADAGAVNRPSNRGASNGMYATLPNAEINLLVAGDDPFSRARTFNLYSIDVAHLFSTPYVPVLDPINLTFYGFLSSGIVVAQSFTIAPPPVVGGVQTAAFQTLTFGSAFRGVEEVAWFQGPAYLSLQNQFTNVVAEVTPEPSTYVLLGAGLAGVFVIARRRRTA